MAKLTINEFVGAVATMRHLQKEYFRLDRSDPRKTDLLIRSRQAESEVDEFINDYQQLNLF